VDIAIFFPILLLIGFVYLVSRSNKNRQRQAMAMRDSMEPGTGVRTIGGMYALVKEVREDTVLLEIEPGIHAVYAKNAIHAVLEHDEYERILSGEPEPDEDAPVVPDDASSLAESDETAEESGEPGDRVELDKQDAGEEPDVPGTSRDPKAEGENGSRS
jgi:preprotein translocase subunit YajC